MPTALPDLSIREGTDVPTKALLDLYESVGWTAYTQDPDTLANAVAQSTYVVTAWEGETLVGLARVLSDDATLAFLQDILVVPRLQGARVGSMLMGSVLDRFAHVRQKVLLTDDDPAQHRFYGTHGFSDTQLLRKTKLHAFVRYEGMFLS